MTNTFKTAFCALTLMAAPAIADTTVILTTPDNSINVSGDLVGFNGTEYVVLSAVGIVAVAADSVICQGSACATTRSESFAYAGLSHIDDSIALID